MRLIKGDVRSLDYSSYSSYICFFSAILDAFGPRDTRLSPVQRFPEAAEELKHLLQDRTGFRGYHPKLGFRVLWSTV